MLLGSKRSRNPSVEAYRIALMLGITMLHVVGNAQLGYDWLANMLHPCVTAFAFVSGWFGCKCRVGKFVRLYAVAIFCAAVMTTVLMHSQYVATQFGTTWVSQFLRMLRNYWFLHAYAAMMLVAPLIDAAVDIDYSRANEKIVRGRIVPILFLSFVWSFFATFHFVESWMPRTSGLGAYTSLTLIGAYAAARYCRWSGCLDRLPNSKSVMIFAVCVCLAAFKLGRYNSPVALFMAAITFKWARKLKIREGSWVCWCSASMFSIYLLQVNDFMFPFIKDIALKISSVLPNGIVVIVAVTTVIFILSLLVDVARRTFVSIVVCVVKQVVPCKFTNPLLLRSVK